MKEGKRLQHDASKWLSRMLPLGLVCIVLFFVVRIFGGIPGILRTFPEIFAREAGSLTDQEHALLESGCIKSPARAASFK
jgi:hypothetical protein